MKKNPVQAFPSGDGTYAKPHVNGMTLRDWFATHAPEPSSDQMQIERGVDRGRNPYNEPHKPKLRSDDEIKAQLAYRYADALLAERERDE